MAECATSTPSWSHIRCETVTFSNGPVIYAKIINAKETDVRLVVIDGVKRYGTPTLMKKVTGPTDSVMVGGERRVLNLNFAAGSASPTSTYS